MTTPPCYCIDNQTECQPAGSRFGLFFPSATRSRCFCIKNRLTNITSDCYQLADWFEAMCEACEPIGGLCVFPTSLNSAGRNNPCICNRVSNSCVSLPTDVVRFKRSIEPFSNRKKVYFTYTQCECLDGNNCTPIVVPKGKPAPSDLENNFCLCFYNVRRIFTTVTRVFEDCVPVDQWRSRGCKNCQANFVCEFNTAVARGEADTTSCLCNDKKEMCIEETVGITPPPPPTEMTTPSMAKIDEEKMYDKAQGLEVC